MADTAPSSDARTFTYREIVDALAFIHEVSEQDAATFDARIRHFQKLGIAPASPGKGKRIPYGLADVSQLAFSLELGEFGVAPEIIKMIIDVRGRSVVEAWKLSLAAAPSNDLAVPDRQVARDPGNDMIFWFTPSLLIRRLAREGFREDLIRWSGIEKAAAISVSFLIAPIGMVDPVVRRESYSKGERTPMKKSPQFSRRLLTINVSELCHAVEAALRWDR
ncbi:MAG: hypothetical protein WDN46_12455 [Methylocella sp.]